MPKNEIYPHIFAGKQIIQTTQSSPHIAYTAYVPYLKPDFSQKTRENFWSKKKKMSRSIKAEPIGSKNFFSYTVKIWGYDYYFAAWLQNIKKRFEGRFRIIQMFNDMAQVYNIKISIWYFCCY